MPLGLSGKVVAIAGGAAGIGAAAGRRLASHGVQVAVGDVNVDGASALCDEIRGEGGTASPYRVDLADEHSVSDFVRQTVAVYGRLDGYVNNAADVSKNNLGRDSDPVDIPQEVWQRTLDVNLTGYMYGIRYAVPSLVDSGGGSIVNISSNAAFMGEPVRVAYATTKAAILALSRNVAARYGKDGIRSNCIAPGSILTESAMANMGRERVEAALAAVPSTRLGRPEDVAAMIAFLVSDDAEWVNGQVFRVNGGQSFS